MCSIALNTCKCGLCVGVNVLICCKTYNVAHFLWHHLILKDAVYLYVPTGGRIMGMTKVRQVKRVQAHLSRETGYGFLIN